MNQDFAILATPAIARRVLLLSRNNDRVRVPAGLEEMANQDRLAETDFDPFICRHTPEREAITQFLLDSDMRGVVQAAYHPAIDELTLLNIVRLARTPRLTILSLRRTQWKHAVAAYQLPDVIIQSPYEMTGHEIDTRRNGILIIDLHQLRPHNGQTNNRFVREFPRTILYQPAETGVATLSWASLAAILFPTMPHPWMIRTVKNNPPHWARMQLHDFLHFYNVCIFPEYITSSELLNSLKEWSGDEAAPTREQHGVFAW